MAKLTTLMAIIFVITSLSYTYVTSSRPTGKSTILDVRIEDMPPATPSKETGDAEKAAPSDAQNSAPAAQTAPSSGTAPAPADVKDGAHEPAPPAAPAAKEPKNSGQSGN